MRTDCTVKPSELPLLPLVAVWVGSFVAAVVACEVVYRLTGHPK